MENSLFKTPRKKNYTLTVKNHVENWTITLFIFGRGVFMIRGSLGVIFAFSMLFLGIGFIFIADGLLVSSTAIILKKQPQIVTGIITACLFVGALLGIFFTPKLIARLGFLRSYAVISAIFALVCLLHTTTDHLIFWGVFRVVVGYCYYSIVLIAETWLNARAIDQIRSRVLSFYEIVFYLGFISGTLIMGLDLPTLWIFIIATGFVILGQIPLNLTFIKAPQIKKSQKTPFSLFQIAPLALITSIAAGLLMNGFFTMAPLYAISAGKTTFEASLFMIVGMLGGLCAHTFCGKISDHFGRRITIIAFTFLAVAASALLFLTETTTLGFFGSAVFLGAGICVLYSLALARANDHLKDKALSVEIGRRLLFCYLMGSFASPVIIGIFLHLWDSTGYPLFNVTISAILLVVALTQNSLPAHKRQHFQRHGGLSSVFYKNQPMPPTSTTSNSQPPSTL